MLSTLDKCSYCRYLLFRKPPPLQKNPGIYKSKVPLLPYLPSFGSLLPFLYSLFQIFSTFPLLSIFFSAFRGEGRTRLWEGRAWGWGYIQNFSTEFRLTNNFSSHSSRNWSIMFPFSSSFFVFSDRGRRKSTFLGLPYTTVFAHLKVICSISLIWLQQYIYIYKGFRSNISNLISYILQRQITFKFTHKKRNSHQTMVLRLDGCSFPYAH